MDQKPNNINTVDRIEKIHPVYDLLTDDIKILLQEILSGDADGTITYIYGAFSNGKKTLIELLKKIFRVVEIADELSIDHYYHGYMDGRLEILKNEFDFEPDIFVNMNADYNYLRYYSSYTFQNWLKNYEVPVIILTNFLPCFINTPQCNTKNIRVIRMHHTFRSENDPECMDWISYITSDSRIQIKPALQKHEVVNDKGVDIIVRIANGLQMNP